VSAPGAARAPRERFGPPRSTKPPGPTPRLPRLQRRAGAGRPRLAEEDRAGRAWSRAHGYRGYTSYASLDDLPPPSLRLRPAQDPARPPRRPLRPRPAPGPGRPPPEARQPLGQCAAPRRRPLRPPPPAQRHLRHLLRGRPRPRRRPAPGGPPPLPPHGPPPARPRRPRRPPAPSSPSPPPRARSSCGKAGSATKSRPTPAEATASALASTTPGERSAQPRPKPPPRSRAPHRSNSPEFDAPQARRTFKRTPRVPTPKVSRRAQGGSRPRHQPRLRSRSP
jgi:hypothetical protein